MYILATHTSLNQDKKENFGPFHNIENFLKLNKINYVSQKEVISVNPIRIILKIIKDIIIIYRYRKYKAYIGFDPINALAGIIGKRLFNRKIKVIFYSIDYSKKRIGVKFLDNLYIILDKFVTVHSDETWSCSYKVYDLRTKYKKDNNYLVPNLPIFDKPKVKKYERFTIVFTGYLNKIYRIDLLKELITNLKHLDVDLLIIGDGYEKNALAKLIDETNSRNRVSLMGYLNHEKVIKELSKSYIGLALYSGSESYDEYRDSMKIREFTFLELPTLCTRVIPNSIEVDKNSLGFVIENYKELEEKIIFLKKPENLHKFQVNCREYNKKVSVEKMYKDRIIKY